MEKYDFQQINYELKDIRKQRKILGERKHSLKIKYFVPNSLRKIVGYKPNEEFAKILNEIYKYDCELYERYSEFREKYRDRFGDFNPKELTREYYKISDRINDLEKRLDKVKKIDDKVKEIFCSKKKNRIYNLVKDIEDELYRRGRAFEDFEKEAYEDRGINVEAMVFGERDLN